MVCCSSFSRSFTIISCCWLVSLHCTTTTSVTVCSLSLSPAEAHHIRSPENRKACRTAARTTAPTAAAAPAATTEAVGRSARCGRGDLVAAVATTTTLLFKVALHFHWLLVLVARLWSWWWWLLCFSCWLYRFIVVCWPIAACSSWQKERASLSHFPAASSVPKSSFALVVEQRERERERA